MIFIKILAAFILACYAFILLGMTADAFKKPELRKTVVALWIITLGTVLIYKTLWGW